MDDPLWGLAVGAAIGASVVVLARGLRQVLRSLRDGSADDPWPDFPEDRRPRDP